MAVQEEVRQDFGGQKGLWEEESQACQSDMEEAACTVQKDEVMTYVPDVV